MAFGQAAFITPPDSPIPESRPGQSDVADGTQRAATKVAQITDSARTEEIARMISGATITDEARAAALELIKGANAP